jgi:hypothetical protein
MLFFRREMLPALHKLIDNETASSRLPVSCLFSGLVVGSELGDVSVRNAGKPDGRAGGGGWKRCFMCLPLTA